MKERGSPSQTKRSSKSELEKDSASELFSGYKKPKEPASKRPSEASTRQSVGNAKAPLGNTRASASMAKDDSATELFSGYKKPKEIASTRQSVASARRSIGGRKDSEPITKDTVSQLESARSDRRKSSFLDFNLFSGNRRWSIFKDSDSPGDGRNVHLKTVAIAEDISKETAQLTIVICFCIQVLYIIVVSIYCLEFNSQSIFYMNAALKKHFLQSFTGADDLEKEFQDITLLSDIWAYSEQVFIPTVFSSRKSGEPYNRDADMSSTMYLYYLLGSPRLRQLKVKDGTCEIWKPMKNITKDCYGEYSDENKATNSFGPRQSTAWKFSDESETQELALDGYPAEGYYIDLDQDFERALDSVVILKQNLWLSRESRAVFLKAAFYNANLNLFGLVIILFALLPTGEIQPTGKFYTLKLVSYGDSWEQFAQACEIIFYIMTIFYALAVIREFVYFNFRIFKRFWTYIDITLFICICISIYLSMQRTIAVDSAIKMLKTRPKSYGNIETAADYCIFSNQMAAINTFLVYIRTFQYLKLTKSMGQLNKTLRKCLFDISMFSVIFLIVFFAFCHFGNMLFGAEVAGFRTFNATMFTLFRMVFGDFDYQAMTKTKPVLGPMFFLLYIICVFFILLNLFLSIISDTYSDVKSDILEENEMTTFQYLRLKLAKLCKCCKIFLPSQHKTEENIEHEKIRNALKSCGFSDLEIEMFFARYNIDPVAEVGQHDLKEIMEQAGKRGNLQDDGVIKGHNVTINAEDFKEEEKGLAQIETTLKLLHETCDKLADEVDKKIEEAKQRKEKSTTRRQLNLK